MATSSITKDIIIDDPERFLDAIMQSAKKQGIDIDAEDCRKSPKWPDYDYIDDINDIFPFVPKGEFKRVKDDAKDREEV